MYRSLPGRGGTRRRQAAGTAQAAGVGWLWLEEPLSLPRTKELLPSPRPLTSIQAFQPKEPRGELSNS